MKGSSFGVVISISTIGHIGMDNPQFYTSDSALWEGDRRAFLEAVREFKQLLKLGGVCLITSSLVRAHDHGWIQVFVESMGCSLISKFNPTSSKVQHYGYSAAGWDYLSAANLADSRSFDTLERMQNDSNVTALSRRNTFAQVFA